MSYESSQPLWKGLSLSNILIEIYALTRGAGWRDFNVNPGPYIPRASTEQKKYLKLYLFHIALSVSQVILVLVLMEFYYMIILI